ncbi:MAG: 16S rRNA (guanine(966)-N(2))-methyltransferase RsmD [Myxococcales bacterium]|nr:16S rRNA (guanine(966)-N(2))-methyltransferase RsmD [Myxococcales bacterium]
MSPRDHRPRITGGKWKGRILIGGVPKNVRPTSSRVREAIGSIIASKLSGSRVLDLFGGAGTFSLEAISRGAAHVVTAEKNRSAQNAILESVDGLDIENFRLIRGDAIGLLKRGPDSDTERFDIIFVDPPYQSGLYETVLDLIVRRDWLNDNGIVIVERATRIPMSDPPAGLAITGTHRYGDTCLVIYDAIIKES